MSWIVNNPSKEIPLLVSRKVNKAILDRCEDLTENDMQTLHKALTDPASLLRVLYFFRGLKTGLSLQTLFCSPTSSKPSSSLVCLYICSNRLSADHVKIMSKSSSLLLQNLETMHLWDDELDDEAAMVLAQQFIPNATRLRELHLPRNQIGTQGIIHLIVAATTASTSCRHLNVAFNQTNINNDTSSYCWSHPLEQALQQNASSLERLVLDGNKNIMKSILVPLLQQCDINVQTLSLARCINTNENNDEDILCLLHALSSNSHVKCINMARNPIHHIHRVVGVWENLLQHQNYTLQSLEWHHHGHVTSKMKFYLEWNRFGRKSTLQQTDTPSSLWPFVLAKHSDDEYEHSLSMLYGTILAKPEVFQR